MSGPLARRLNRNELGLAVAIVVVIVATMGLDPGHVYWNEPGPSARDILRQAVMLGIFALGSTIVIISGGIDLSCGSMIAFSGTICGTLLVVLAPAEMANKTKWYRFDDAALERLSNMESVKPLLAKLQPLVNQTFTEESAFQEKLSTYLSEDEFNARKGLFTSQSQFTKPIDVWVIAVAIAGSLLAGALVGSLHAWLITVVGLPPFIATLATLVGLRSLGRAIIPSVTQGILGAESNQIQVFDKGFRALATNVWIPTAIFLVLSFLAWVLLSRTVVGRHIYALGGNEDAARLSGIRTDRLKWLAYCLGAMTSALAGVLYIGDQSTADPQVLGVGYELNAIAACVVGGCSLKGGVGTIPGTMLGCFFLRIVMDGINKVIKVSADVYEGLIVGMVVVVAVAVNQIGQGGDRARQFFPGALGAVTVLNLAILAGVVAFLIAGASPGLVVGGGSVVALGAVKFVQGRSAGKRGPTNP